jgi:orotate phosphoribosyltransferase
VRKEPKGHGTGNYLEGRSNIAEGSAVVIAEDVVTTGASTIKAIERARDGGYDVRRVLALVDRDEGGRAEVEKHCPLTPLFSRVDFLP